MAAHKQEGKTSIEQRPVESNKRLRLGDWERDCMYGARGERLLVCVDRKSRLTKITKVVGRTVRDITKLTNKLLQETKRKIHTITNDNGPEFRHPDGAIAPVYYCHPRRPQERGTVENTIGLIRQYIKRTTDLTLLTNQDIKHVEEVLNFRPRKCLDYKTPYEVFYGKSVALAL
jgi:IS30 family transposase